jgi:hypothetical protein
MSATASPPEPAVLRRAVACGIDWVEDQLQPDGSFSGSEHDLAGYYKSMLALAVCGRLESAARCRAFLRVNLRGADGELSSGKVKTGIERMARNLANYMDGWVAIAAWMLEDFELGEEIARRLVQDQSGRHGGILTGPERWAGPPRYDLATAASCGRALLFCGHRDAAYAAGAFLVEALEHQVAPDERLDLVFDDGWGVVAAPDEGERSYYRFELSRRGEKVWFPAFACAFLCELHSVTHDAQHLRAAEAYYGFVERTSEFRDGTIANGKSGWSAGLLTLATGREQYRSALRQIAGNVLTRQADDGEFTAAGAAATAGTATAGTATARAASTSGSTAEMPRRLERTAEFTTWTAEFLRMSATGVMESDAG